MLNEALFFAWGFRVYVINRVRSVYANRAKKGMNVRMIIPNSLGRFRIDGIEFYSYQFMDIRSRNSYGKKRHGWVVVDSLPGNSSAIIQISYDNEEMIPDRDSFTEREN